MEKYEKLALKYIGLLVLIAIGLMNWNEMIHFIGKLWGILGPVTNGCIFAYILNLLTKGFENFLFKNPQKKWQKQFKRPISIVLGLLSFVLVIMLVIVLVVPQLATAISKLIEVIPSMATTMQNWVQDYNEYFPQLESLMKRVNFDWGTILQQTVNVLNGLSANLLNTLLAMVTGLASNTINSILSLMLALYIVGTKEQLAAQAKRVLFAYIRPKRAMMILDMLRLLDESFSSFFVGMTIEGVILGSLIAVVTTLFGIPYSGMLGVIAGVMALIPILGGYISAGFGVVMLLAVSPSQAFLYLALAIIVQQFEGNLIYPRVVGGSIGLPGLWVLISVTVGGGLMGVPGMIIGVPLAATCYKWITRDVKRRETIVEN